MTVKEMRELLHLSQAAFGEKYNIPKRSIENWETGTNKCPDYVTELLEHRVLEDAKGIEGRLDFSDLPGTKMIIDQVQNESSALRYGFDLHIGQEYYLHIFGRVVDNGNSYHLELIDGKRTNRGSFPMAHAHDSAGNQYTIYLISAGCAGAFRE